MECDRLSQSSDHSRFNHDFVIKDCVGGYNAEAVKILIFAAEGLTKRSAVGFLLRSLIMFQTFISRHNSNFFSDKLVLTSVTPASSAPVLQTPKATSSTLYFDSLTVNAGNGGFLHCIQMDTSVNAANQVVSVGADIAFDADPKFFACLVRFESSSVPTPPPTAYDVYPLDGRHDGGYYTVKDCVTIDVLPRTPDNNVYVGFMVWSNFNIIARRTGNDVNSHTVLDGIITTIMATIQRINIIGSREGSRNRRRLKANQTGKKFRVGIKSNISTNRNNLISGVDRCIHLNAMKKTTITSINRQTIKI